MLRLLLLFPFCWQALQALDAPQASEKAHQEIWRRFIDDYGIMLDFTDLRGEVSLPTPEECAEGKPNALGWWSPIENGAMFNGLYIEAALHRWQRTQKDEDAEKARQLMRGLLHLNRVSSVRGFVARGVSTDGKSHYPMGSNDQTLPWFLGLWRYWESALASSDEKRLIEQHIRETAEVIIEKNWAMPAEPPFDKRGSFQGFHFEEATRMLFTLKLLQRITVSPQWDKLYLRELQQRGGEKNLSKRELCRAGMAFFYAKTHNWTSCTAVGALRALWELEKVPELKADYAAGLSASARLASESLVLAKKFDLADKSHFEMDWRLMNKTWKPQKTELDAQNLAQEQLRDFLKKCPRRQHETAFVREPTSAAWIVSLCPDQQMLKAHLPALESVISHYDYSQLYYSQFFWVDMAWERLQRDLSARPN